VLAVNYGTFQLMILILLVAQRAISISSPADALYRATIIEITRSKVQNSPAHEGILGPNFFQLPDGM